MLNKTKLTYLRHRNLKPNKLVIKNRNFFTLSL